MLLTDLDTRAAHCTVHAVLQAVAQRQPQADLLFTEDVTAAQYGITPGTVSYGQALATVAQWRQAYQAAGYGHGHRVGLLLDNRPQDGLAGTSPALMRLRPTCSRNTELR